MKQTQIDILDLAGPIVFHDVIGSGQYDIESIKTHVKAFLLQLLNMQVPEGSSIAEDCEVFKGLCGRIERDIQKALNQKMSRLIPPDEKIIGSN